MNSSVLFAIFMMVEVCFCLLPGVNIYLGQSGLVKAKNKVLPILLDKVRSLVIPAGSGDHFKYDPIRFDSINVADAPISLAAPNLIKVGLSNLQLTVPKTSFEIWEKILGIKISCGGKLWASTSGTNVAVTLTIADVNGHPQVTNIVPQISFGSLSVDHSMDSVMCKIVDELASLFVDVNGKIEDAIKSQIPSLLSGQVKDIINSQLGQLTMLLNVDSLSDVSYLLASDVNISSSYLGLPLKGEFFSHSQPVESKQVPPQMPVPVLNRDVVAEASEYVLNTAAEIFTAAGALKVQNVQLPSQFTTSFLELIIPAVYAKCKNCPLMIDYGISSPPVAEFFPGQATVSVASSALNVTVLMPDGSHWNIFDLAVNGTAQISFTVKEPYIKINVGLMRFDMKVISSAVGPFNVELLSEFVNFAISKVVLPIFDAEFAGIPFPHVDQVTIINPEIIQLSHALVIGSDLSFP